MCETGFLFVVRSTYAKQAGSKASEKSPVSASCVEVTGLAGVRCHLSVGFKDSHSKLSGLFSKHFAH